MNRVKRDWIPDPGTFLLWSQLDRVKSDVELIEMSNGRHITATFARALSRSVKLRKTSGDVFVERGFQVKPEIVEVDGDR